MMERARVTIHMAASLDGYIARRDGRVDWMETPDDYPDGETMDADYVAEVLRSIDCYVMGARTYETALDFEARGMGWAYGDTPVFVLTHRELEVRRDSVELVAGDLGEILRGDLAEKYASIWVAGGGRVAGECVQRGLADEIRYSVLPVLIGDGISFFEGLDADVKLHLREVKAYRNGMVAMRHDIVPSSRS